jgi:excisionase family DNA binding protein
VTEDERTEETERLLRIREVAERTSTTRWFVSNEIQRGRLHSLRLGGGPRPLIRIKESDFLAWLEAGDDA